MICPNCEKEIEPNQPQCPHCGCHFPISQLQKPAPIPEPTIEKQQEKAEELDEKVEAAEYAAERKCPECGKSVPLTAQFCKWCGSSLSKEQDAQQTTSEDNLPEDDLQPEESPKEKCVQPEMAEDLDEKELSEFPDEKTVPAETTESVAEQKCPECGKAVPPNARFCKWCGTPLSKEQDDQRPVLNQATSNEENTPPTKICGNCGRTIKATALFCKWCGSPCNDKNKEEE